MELDSASWMQIVIGTALFLVGVFVGLMAGRGGRGARARARRLEVERRQTQERLAGYEDQVAKHFAQASDLFGDLTRQYSAVWDHLAEGARELCAERAPALGRGFTEAPLLLTQTPATDAEPPLTETPPEPEPAPHEAPESPDLTLEDDRKG